MITMPATTTPHFLAPAADAAPARAPEPGFTGRQCRLARARLGVGVRELADEVGIAQGAVTRFERGLRLAPRVVAALREALESAAAAKE